MNEFERIGQVARTLAPILERTGDNPVQFVGRLVGLGRGEMKAGIPGWGWASVGLVAGVAVMWVWGDQIKRAVGRS